MYIKSVFLFCFFFICFLLLPIAQHWWAKNKRSVKWYQRNWWQPLGIQRIIPGIKCFAQNILLFSVLYIWDTNIFAFKCCALKEIMLDIICEHSVINGGALVSVSVVHAIRFSITLYKFSHSERRLRAQHTYNSLSKVSNNSLTTYFLRLYCFHW